MNAWDSRRMHESALCWAMAGAGMFTVALGIVHFFMPILFDFEHALPDEGPPLRPFRLFFFRYATGRSDVRGIAWVMNHAVSYTLVSVGVADLSWWFWRGERWAWLGLAWIGVFWLLRAATQRYLGSRPGDRAVMGWLGGLALLHLMAAAA
jgi:hypothetical protein